MGVDAMAVVDPQAARARHDRAADRGRLDHADGDEWQHRRADEMIGERCADLVKASLGAPAPARMQGTAP